MRKTACLSLLVLTLLACSGDSDSPSEPDGAPVAGSYAGTLTVKSGMPSDHCVARWLATQGDLRLTASATLTENSGAIGGTITTEGQVPLACQMLGVRGGSVVSWRQTGCTRRCVAIAPPQLGCLPLEVCSAAQHFTGTVDGRRLSGEYELSWDVTEQEGTPLGRVELRGSLDIRR